MVSDGMFEGAMIGAAINARRQASSLAATVDQANANIRYLNGVVAEQNAAIEQLQARIAQLSMQVAVKEADSAGTRAQLDVFKQTHPTSPALADSGRRYNDGDIKSVSRLAYEAAFDAKARQLGIVEPEQYRAD
jgi:hypothetical protein